MGIVKKLLKAIFGFFLFSSLITFATLYSVKGLSEYENIKKIAYPVFFSQLNLTEDKKSILLFYLSYMCEGKDLTKMELGTENITINCSKVRGLSKDNLEQFLFDAYIDNIYYKRYECDLVECIKQQNFMYFISVGFHEEIQRYLTYLAISSLVFGIILLLILRRPQEILVNFSTIFILVGANYIFIELLLESPLISKTPSILSAINIIKSNLVVFMYFLIAGLALLSIYFVIKIKDFYFKKRKK